MTLAAVLCCAFTFVFTACFNVGYEQSTFHKKTGWGKWLGMNDQWLYANPKCGGEDTPQQD